VAINQSVTFDIGCKELPALSTQAYRPSARIPSFNHTSCKQASSSRCRCPIRQVNICRLYRYTCWHMLLGFI